MTVRIKTGEPIRLSGKRMAFTDYGFIRPPDFGWYDAEGHNVSVFGTAGLYDAELRVKDAPIGINIAARPARRPEGPFVIPPENPWEADGISINNLMFDEDDGYYKAWGACSANGETYMCYLQSRDFGSWERPDLGAVEFLGSRKNNLIEPGGMRHGTIFKDPSSEDERWKWISEGTITREQYDAFREKYPDRWDPRSDRTDAQIETPIGPSNVIIAVKGAVSPDGFRWQGLPEPLVVDHSDTQVIAYYDVRRGKYVGYFRGWKSREFDLNAPDDRGLSWMTGRRSISYAETDDFRRFPLPQIIVEPGPETVTPSETLYTNCHTFVPGTTDQHLLFPAVWNQLNDSTRVAAASSSDGRTIHWLPGSPILTTAPPGSWDGGCVFAFPQLIELPDGTWALPYTGFNVPHKYPRKGAYKSAVGLATWPKGRLAGITAESQGQFTTYAIIPPGRKVLINALTPRGGSVRVEIADASTPSRNAVPGRSFDDCNPVVGDQWRTIVSWKDQDDIGVPPGTPVCLRFKLDQASIFFIDFE